MGLLLNDVESAVTHFYNDDSLNVRYYDVEIDQDEKGHNLKAMYVAKLKVSVNKKNKDLGTDIITLGITPDVSGDTSNETNVKLIKYEHNKNTFR